MKSCSGIDEQWYIYIVIPSIDFNSYELLLRVVVRINTMLISCAVAQYLGMKESLSLQWTVALFMVQSANRVTANKFYAIAKISDREADVKANRCFLLLTPLWRIAKDEFPN